MLENVTPELKTHIINVCKIGKGADCCRYLTASSEGFECGKLHSKVITQIDINVARGIYISQAINCMGLDLIELETKGAKEQKGKDIERNQ